MKKRIVLVLFLIAILCLTALIPCNAEGQASAVKWTQRESNLYETQTFYFTVLARIKKQENLYILDKLIGKLDQITKYSLNFIESGYKGSFGLFLDLDPNAPSFKWDQYRGYFKNAYLTRYENLIDAEIFVILEDFDLTEVIGPGIVDLVLSVSSETKMPYWMNAGFSQWCYDKSVNKNRSWDVFRKENTTSFAYKNNVISKIYPLSAPQTWTSSSLTWAKATSIFHFLENRFGAEAVSTFLKAWLEQPNVESAILKAFGSSQKELESAWRLFVLFEGISQYQWVDTSNAYQATVSSAQLSIKKGSTVWYDQTLDKQVQKIVAANALIESFQPTFKKTPVLKFEFFKSASKNGVKKSSSGFDIKVTEKGAESIAADFVKVAAEKAVAALKYKSLPKSVIEGFGQFVAAQAGVASIARNADFFDSSAATGKYDHTDISNAMSFLLETYGSSKIVPLMFELNNGSSLRAAVVAAAGESEEQIDAALDFVRYLPLPSKLEWARIPGGFSTEIGDLRFDVENQAIKTRMKSDLEQTIVTCAEIAQKLADLTGWKPDDTTGKIIVRLGAGAPDGSESIFIPIATDNFEYAAEDLPERIVDHWLTRAARGSEPPSWLVHGLCGVLKKWEPDEVSERVKTLNVLPGDWTIPFGTEGSGSEQQDLWYLAAYYLLGAPDSLAESNDSLKLWLTAAAIDGFEAGMEKALGYNFNGFLTDWRCHMQVNSHSDYDWLNVGENASRVTYETIINGQKIRVLMAREALNYQGGYDMILDQIGQNPAKFAALIGMPEAPQLTFTLDITGQSQTFFRRSGTEIVVDAVSEYKWPYSGAAAFETARCLAELYWQSLGSETGSAATLPIWLRDGLAAYFMNTFSHSWEFSYHDSKKTVKPDSRLYFIINSYSEDQVFGEELQLLGSLFAFLEEKQSGNVKQFFAKMAAGADIELAIRETTGQEITDFETEWLDMLR